MKKSRILKAVAAAALALATLVAVPATAQAVDGYTPTPGDSRISYSGSIVPGGSISIQFQPGMFDAGTRVIFTLSGEGVGPVNLATLLTVDTVAETAKTAASDGSSGVKVTFPSDARCQYTLTAAGENPAQTYSTTYDLGNCAGGAGTGLATTGSSGDQLLWAWVGGGALAFVGGGVLVFSAVRKQRKLAE